MRKYLSAFYLASRASYYKILLVMLASGVIQFIFFNNELSELSSAENSNGNYRDLERVISLSAINVIFAFTFLLIILLLTFHTVERGSKCGYTLSRLLISEKDFFFIQSIYNATVLTILLGFEVALTFFFATQYVSVADGDYISNQSVFLAYYRNEFLHSLLPLSDVLIWIRNVLQIAAFSLSAAFFSYKQRRGKHAIGVFFLTVFSIIWNSGVIGADMSVILSYLITVFMIGYVLFYVINGWGYDYEC